MIRYSLVRRKNPLKKDAPLKVHATAQAKEVLRIEDVAAHIVRHGSVYDRSVIEGVTMKVADCLRELLLEGYQVELGDLGKFELALKCEGANSAEEFTPEKNISEVNVRWRPSDILKNLREDAEFDLHLPRLVEKDLLKKQIEESREVD